jgi:enoyl-CoA hydratase
MADADILFEHRGKLGLITLNRPKALNALTHDMALRLERQLDLWRDDDAVAVVAIQGAGDRAFCAGGDIRALYDAGREDGRNNWQFYADEYRLNTKIKRYPKPYVSIMDGIVMGGGVGVSVHGSIRIATERTVFAMPETGIGLFPDVGGTYFLPRLPGQIGMWLGLTGTRMKAQDTVQAEICDILLPSAAIELVLDVLAAEGTSSAIGSDPYGAFEARIFEEIAMGWKEKRDFGQVIHRVGTELNARDEIEEAFSKDGVEDVISALGESQMEWCQRTKKTILAKSPTCTRITFRQIREGASLDFEDCMRLEYRLARFCMTQPDFYEGVRAIIIDKDNAPNWSPATLAEADDAYVAPAFAPLGEKELTLA